MGTFRRRNIPIAYRPRVPTLEECLRDDIVSRMDALLAERGRHDAPLPTRRAAPRVKRPAPARTPAQRKADAARKAELIAKIEAVLAGRRAPARERP